MKLEIKVGDKVDLAHGPVGEIFRDGVVTGFNKEGLPVLNGVDEFDPDWDVIVGWRSKVQESLPDNCQQESEEKWCSLHQGRRKDCSCD